MKNHTLLNTVLSLALGLKLLSSTMPAVADGPKPKAVWEEVEALPAEEGSSKNEAPFVIVPKAGFGYRTLARGSEIEEYVDKTRLKFDHSMPGFKDFMKLGAQLPYFTVGVEVQPPWHLLSKDSIGFTFDFDFSSSKIFGSTTDKEIYGASVGAIKLGATPSTWTQDLGFYGSWGIGAKYSPISWGDSFKFKPVVGLRGGFSYLDSKSILHIHVDEDHPENTYPGLDWAALNSVPIYQDIRTDAKTKGWGGFVDSYVGLLLEYLNFTFQANVGYRYEKIPTLTIGEYTVSDGKVETKHSSVKYDASGINAQVLVGYKLKF